MSLPPATGRRIQRLGRLPVFPRRNPLLVWVVLFALTACRQAPGDKSTEATPTPPASESTITVPAGERLSNTIRWAASNEEVIFGYDIFRGVKAEGPFFRITETPVLKDPSSTDSGVYSWIDATIAPNQPYWYYVEGVTKEGQRAPITPIQMAPAKVTSDSASAAQ